MNKLIIITLFIISVVTVNAQQERKHIRKGNREYNNAVIDSVTTDTTLYQDAEVDYRKALDKDPNNWNATYNLANSLLKQGKFEEATRQYQAVTGMDNDNKEDLAKAYHNLGNSQLKESKLDEAIEAYKNSLRNNPNDYETKYNLAWAQNKKQQQEQQQQENQDQNKDQNEDQENKDKDQQDQDKKDNQDQDQKDQEKQQKDQDQQQQQQQQEQKQNKISKEDAMRILEALQNDEKKVQEKVQKQKVKPKNRTTQKDW